MKISIKNPKSVASVAMPINEPIDVNSVKRETTEHVARVQRVVLTEKQSTDKDTGEVFSYYNYRFILDDTFVSLYESKGQTIAKRINYLDFHKKELLTIMQALGEKLFVDLYCKLDELLTAKVIGYISPEYFKFFEGAKIEFSREYRSVGDEIEDFAGRLFTATFNHFSTEFSGLELAPSAVAELKDAYDEARSLTIK